MAKYILARRVHFYDRGGSTAENPFRVYHVGDNLYNTSSLPKGTVIDVSKRTQYNDGEFTIHFSHGGKFFYIMPNLYDFASKLIMYPDTPEGLLLYTEYKERLDKISNLDAKNWNLSVKANMAIGKELLDAENKV